MGFYQPAQIVTDAKNHGVEFRPVDINYSDWDNLLEERSGKYYVVRLGFRHVKGLREEDINLLISNRKTFYRSINELHDINLSQAALEKLVDADAFRSIGLDRRQALWEISTCNDRAVALFAGQDFTEPAEKKLSLPVMNLSEHVVQDFASTSLSLKAHPVSFIREKLQQLRLVSTKELNNLQDGDLIKTAGLVLVRQRPGTAKGVVFITIEDETGTANLVLFPNIFDKYRKAILQSRLLMVEGKLQKEGEVIHVIVQQCFDLSRFLSHLFSSKTTNDFTRDLIQANGIQEAEQLTAFPSGRNFR